MNQSRFPVYVGAAVFLLGAAGLVAGGCLYTVDEREQAVILEFGKPVASRTTPGLYFKAPFVQEVRRLPKTLRFWRTGAEVLQDMPTADGKKIEVSAFAVWKITDPEAFVRTLRTVDQGETAVATRVRSAIRDVVTAHDLEQVVRSTDRKLTYTFQNLFDDAADPAAADPDIAVAVVQPGVSGKVTVGREQITALIGKKVTAQLRTSGGEADAERGIELVEVGISNIEFVPQVRIAAFERQKAFMESIAAGYSNAGVQRKQEILNVTNAEVEKIHGEGEQQSRVIRGRVDADNIAKFATAIRESGDFYGFVRTLEVYEKALGGRTRLVLTTDGELLRMLKSFESETPDAKPATQANAE